jgi:S-adenosylmethionine synthetase
MILKTYNKFTKLDDLDFEVVERKGRCHPDTLADRLAELLSITYSKFTKEKYGVVLRHQFDKLSLMGGKCDVWYGGGTFKTPVRLLINGRMTQRFGDEYINIRDMIINTAREFLEKELVNFNFDLNCRVMWESTSNPTRGMIDKELQGTSAIHHRFSPRSLKDLPESTVPIANDMAVGCFSAPYSKLEKLVLGIEKKLTSDEMRAVYPWLGTDCKILGTRMTDEVNLTISIPQISTLVKSPEEYKKNSEIITKLINEEIEKSTFKDVKFILNRGDTTDTELTYLSLTGSCIESGDEGQVSRGNRLGGPISSRRIFSIEGLSGKNPAYHTGKIYSAEAYDIANDIYETLGTPCEVVILSQMDRVISDPWVVIVNSSEKIDSAKIEEIVHKHIDDTGKITENILQGKYPLNY